MPSLSLSEKSLRTLQFLQSLSLRRVSSAMSTIGFEEADLEEGWTLLRQVRSVRFSKQAPPLDPNHVRLIDAWENRWFPVAFASLKRRFPEIHAALFLNLGQVDGIEAINSVDLFVERYSALAAAGDDTSKEAVAVLAKRGLTPAVIAEAEALLSKVTSIDGSVTNEPTADDKAAEAEREAAMWAWYLEWTALARTVITDRRLLRQMGFLRNSSSSMIEPDEEADGGDGAPGGPGGGLQGGQQGGQQNGRGGDARPPAG